MALDWSAVWQELEQLRKERMPPLEWVKQLQSKRPFPRVPFSDAKARDEKFLHGLLGTASTAFSVLPPDKRPQTHAQLLHVLVPFANATPDELKAEFEADEELRERLDGIVKWTSVWKTVHERVAAKALPASAWLNKLEPVFRKHGLQTTEQVAGAHLPEALRADPAAFHSLMDDVSAALAELPQADRPKTHEDIVHLLSHFSNTPPQDLEAAFNEDPSRRAYVDILVQMLPHEEQRAPGAPHALDDSTRASSPPQPETEPAPEPVPGLKEPSLPEARLPPLLTKRAVPRELFEFLGDHLRRSDKPPALDTLVRVVHGFSPGGDARRDELLNNPSLQFMVEDFEGQRRVVNLLHEAEALRSFNLKQVDSAENAVQKLLWMRRFTAERFPPVAQAPWFKYDVSELYEAAKAELAHAPSEHDKLLEVVQKTFDEPGAFEPYLVRDVHYSRLLDRVKRDVTGQRLNFLSRSADLAHDILEARGAVVASQEPHLLVHQALRELGHDAGPVAEPAFDRFRARRILEAEHEKLFRKTAPRA